MKNKILIIFLSLVTLSVSAQVTSDSVLRSKKGIPILPKKGDWGIGVDALPYLNYLGNIFNNTTNNTLNLGSQTLYGRYFVADNAALRFVLGISKGSDRTSYYVRDDAAFFADPLTKAQATDYRVYKYSNVNFDLGYQKFRGYGKLRGFYGVHAGMGVSRYGYTYNYGNPITVANAAPTTVNNWNTGSTAGLSDRTLDYDYGYTYSVNLGLLAGVDYYILPKICIGGEVDFSLYHSWDSQANAKYEHLNGSAIEEYETAISPKGRTSTQVNTREYPGAFGGSLYVIFHF